MATRDQQDEAAARVYASALFDLAQSKDQVDTLLEELGDLTAHLERDADFADFLSTPSVNTAVRGGVIEKLFRGRYGDLLVDSLQVLNNRERLGALGAVAQAYQRLHKDGRGHVDVHVRTAVPLTDALRTQVRELAGKLAGKQADLVETVDASLLGGLIVQIGDEKFDASVRTRLQTLRSALLERASRELHSGKSHFEAVAV